jgi:hypothetical protein
MAVNDKYKCVLTTYLDGKLYKPGMERFLPAETPYEGEAFILVEKGEKETKKPAPKKKAPPEVEGE